MQEPQLDKVLRQGRLHVKACRNKNWSELENSMESLQIMMKSTCNVAVYKWKKIVYMQVFTYQEVTRRNCEI